MMDRVDRHLGNYRLLRLLGRGGFAEVYLAEHLHLGTQAAIKVLHKVSQKDQELFLREARTIARLEHPHIVRVLEFGIEEETPFLVMNYAANGSLRSRFPRGVPQPLATVVACVRQIADALQYAHDEKLIHRDVKPENMLLGRRDEVLLSDFGIALLVQSADLQSRQDVMGTISYMAPEQIHGRPCKASDQYALAVVVYEWLCGRLPFRGSFTEIATQHMLTPPPPLREKLPGLAPAVEQVVMKALAKQPEQRFIDVKAFASALTLATEPVSLQTVGIEASPTTLPAQPQPALPTIAPFMTPTPQPGLAPLVMAKPARPRRGVSRRAVAGGLLGLLGIGGAVTWLSLARPFATPTAARPAPTARPKATPNVTSAPTLAAGTLFYTYRGHLAGVSGLAWSPNGTYIASGSADQTAQVWEAATGSHLYTYHGQSTAIYNVTWAPDSARVASASPDQTVKVWQAFTGDHLYTYHGSTVMDAVAWSPDGQRIVSCSDDGTAQVWDATTGEHLIVYQGHQAGNHIHMVAWSPDSTRVASAGDDATAQVWDAASGKQLFIYHGHARTVWDVAWSPDGLLLASASDDGTVQIWEAATGNALYTYHGHSGVVRTAAWSPDSKRIASAGDDMTVQIWEASSGNLLYTYRRHTSLIWRVVWSPRGSAIASASNDTTVQVWSAG